MKISASFLSIENNLKEKIKKLCETEIDYLHLDIMDGVFVSNKTWSIDEMLYLLQDVNKPLDVHLMVSDIEKYIEEFKLLNPLYITFHYELNVDIMKIINKIRSLNIKVGLSIKPNTSIEEIINYLPYLDLVLIMSVEPGEGGQLFLNSSIDKVNRLKEIKEENNYHFAIEVDGGINNENIGLINNADTAVVGSYITNGDYEDRIKKLKESIYG